MAEKVTFINSRGQSIEISNRLPFLLENIDGKGDVQADIQTSKAPYQDGNTFIDARLQPRPLTLYISIVETSRNGLLEKRQLLSSIFNPSLGKGKLIYENGNTKREIWAVSENVPTFPLGSDNKGQWYQKSIVNLLCPDPYWQDTNPTNIKLEDFVSHFRFPFHFPVRFASRGDSRVLVNTGDAPAPIKVTFRGEVVNPKITNLTTGEFILINYAIPEGYNLIITTDFNGKDVNIVAPDGVETNGMGFIDLSSEFFMLRQGENAISFLSDGGKPEVYVEFRNRYVSV
ncbi:phage tail family protein [Bacillus sp. Gen3]|uniref:Phage tail family protein n=1 Tax=Heyndrickxia oleronia TaxID=38875 RepID=A0AAW6SRQ2_9BACI|nr:phage tail family protein [Heyndrickxia oleronia]MDH5161515.1 phage tail family protein [Heyndrickxia oleronia]NYV66184.1 phage tail family protein [Bacillus sp. Gen3]